MVLPDGSEMFRKIRDLAETNDDRARNAGTVATQPCTSRKDLRRTLSSVEVGLSNEIMVEVVLECDGKNAIRPLTSSDV